MERAVCEAVILQLTVYQRRAAFARVPADPLGSGLGRDVIFQAEPLHREGRVYASAASGRFMATAL